jgi:hypothetical protein
MALWTATLEGAEELATRWASVRAAVRAGMRRGVARGVEEGAREARARHLFKNRTGNLEKSIQGRVTGSRAGAPTRRRKSVGSESAGDFGAVEAHWGVIESKLPYASYVEDGTRPHVIVPKKARLLHWEEPQGDHHFARRVKHPGTRPLPFMAFAYVKCERVMIREIEIGVADAQRILDR